MTVDPQTLKHPIAYRAFGRIVLSDRPIPFERAVSADAEPALTLSEAPDLRSQVGLGALDLFHDAEDLPGGPRLRGYRGASASVVVFDHPEFTLRFWLADDRVEYALAEERDDAFRFGLMVERFAVPLFVLFSSEQTIGVHGGAVAMDGVHGELGWSFLGPSGAGKSTTARTLLDHGARLIADDLTLIDTARQLVLPGCPAVRLWEEEGAVGQAIHDVQLMETTTKRWYRLGPSYVQNDPIALGGLIVLDPLPAGEGAPSFEFARLRGQEAFAAVMKQVFNFSDPPPEFATRLFRSAKDLISHVPVLRYRYRRSADGQPTHVGPLVEQIQNLSSSQPPEAP